VLEAGSVPDLTVRGVARRAGISERTVFRYFATREEFLDAVATEVMRELELPPLPSSVDEILAFPRALYTVFEAKQALTRAALHSELFPRIRERSGGDRLAAIRRVVDAWAPRRPERAREIAALNVRFFLSAWAWQYYRFYFRVDVDEAIACAETAIRQSLDAIAPAPRRRAGG
jgi:AcrR family transcriptional regulator